MAQTTNSVTKRSSNIHRLDLSPLIVFGGSFNAIDNFSLWYFWDLNFFEKYVIFVVNASGFTKNLPCQFLMDCDSDG